MTTGIDNPHVIDLVTHDPKRDEYALIMFATEPWDKDSVLSLQEKTKSYLNFIKSGQLLAKYPEARGKRVRFQLDHAHEISPLAMDFVSAAAREWLSELDIQFVTNKLQS